MKNQSWELPVVVVLRLLPSTSVCSTTFALHSISFPLWARISVSVAGCDMSPSLASSWFGPEDTWSRRCYSVRSGVVSTESVNRVNREKPFDLPLGKGRWCRKGPLISSDVIKQSFLKDREGLTMKMVRRHAHWTKPEGQKKGRKGRRRKEETRIFRRASSNTPYTSKLLKDNL